MNRPYFPRQEGAPPPLHAEYTRSIRFEEVDSLGIVWHGRYPSFFEDARVALGDKYGIGYLDFYHHGILTPIKQMHVDYHLPLRFKERITIQGIMHWTEAARLDFEFIVRNEADEIATTGYTVQMMLAADNSLLLVPPPFYREFLDRWQGGGCP